MVEAFSVDVTTHHHPLTKEDLDYKGSTYNVMVEWEAGKVSYEPLSVIAKDEPVTYAAYAKRNGLLDPPE